MSRRRDDYPVDLVIRWNEHVLTDPDRVFTAVSYHLYDTPVPALLHFVTRGDDQVTKAVDMLGLRLHMPNVPGRDLATCATVLHEHDVRSKYLPMVAQGLATHPNADTATRVYAVTMLARYLNEDWAYADTPRSADGWTSTALQVAAALLSPTPVPVATYVTAWQTCPDRVPADALQVLASAALTVAAAR